MDLSTGRIDSESAGGAPDHEDESVTAALEAFEERIGAALNQFDRRTKKQLTHIIDRLANIETHEAVNAVPELGQELSLAANWRRHNVVEVSQPLALITQVQRSGGTLLSQLFDCHPQCHTHPSELKFAASDPDGSFLSARRPIAGEDATAASPSSVSEDGGKTWPIIKLDAAAAVWWQALEERRSREHFLRGYAKKVPGLREPEIFPFLFLPSLARQLFMDQTYTRDVESSRDVLNAYFTAYFNAWLDNHNLYTRDKRWIVAFAPDLIRTRMSRAAFFSDYPDGKLISIVRDPAGWYSSAQAYHPRYRRGLEGVIAYWRDSTLAALEAKREHPDGVVLVSFERLVQDTRRTMQSITALLDLDLPEIALRPTFNGRPIKADSSFPVAEHGVLRAPAIRGSTLSTSDAKQIHDLVGSVHEAAMEVAI